MLTFVSTEKEQHFEMLVCKSVSAWGHDRVRDFWVPPFWCRPFGRRRLGAVIIL